MLAQILTNGLVLAGSYALVAVGLTLTFGVMRMVNFAEGQSVMIGAFVAFTCVPYVGYVGAIAAAMASTASGTLIRKTGRHDKPNQSPSVITAPRMGPVTAARPITDVNIPIAFPRSAGGYST